MRSKNFVREMREKHIRRKKRIAEKHYGWGYYRCDGKYDKGKIHCSCSMCAQKTNNKGKNRLKRGNYYPSKNWKHSDAINIESMEQELQEYFEEEVETNGN